MSVNLLYSAETNLYFICIMKMPLNLFWASTISTWWAKLIFIVIIIIIITVCIIIN